MGKAENLKKYISQKNCLKIICGANNEDYSEIKKLVALYSMAGCTFFDINASSGAYEAVVEGLKITNCFDDFHFICLSIGVDDDIHFSKCFIDDNLCKKCAICEKICPQNAIVDCKIIEKKCIGCSRCLKSCSFNAIKSYQTKNNIDEISNLLLCADCVEFHISSSNQDEIKSKWKKIISKYRGLISVCINRAVFDENTLLDLLNYLFQSYPNIMIQADGKPMSGSVNDYNTTLQAVAFADLLRKSKITCPIFVSGGTNSKTKDLLNLTQVDVDGISVGSYARKIVRKYIERSDFFSNKDVFNEALAVAKNFVNQIIR